MTPMSNPSSKEPASVFQRPDQAVAYPYSVGEYAGRFAWEWIERLLFRPSPRRAYRWRSFWLRRFGARLDPKSCTRPTTNVMHPWLLKMGRHSIISNGVTVYNLGPVTIGDYTIVSQDVYICAGSHDYTKPDFPLQRLPITIGSGVWICAGAFIGPSVTIGDNSIVGARAVVTKDVPAGVIVAGNPARVIKPRPMTETHE